MEYGIKNLDADIMTMASQGFRMADSSAYEEAREVDNLDHLKHDILMVKDGSVPGELLPEDFKAIACIHSRGLSNSFLHMTLSDSTSQEQLDKLHGMGGFFFELKDGRHAGYVNMLPFGVKDKEGVVQGFEDRMMEISSMGLKTEPYSFSRQGLSLLPFMLNKDGKLDNVDAFKMASKVVDNLKYCSDSVGIPVNILDRAMEAKMGYRTINENNYSNGPKMSPSLRPS
jgi:hypothetical protein